MTEDDAVEITRWGEPPQLAEPKEHTEIGHFDMERGAKVSGSRFGFIVGDTALVALALYRFALDRLVREGFTPVLPPVLVREEAMYGTGFFPSDKSDYYEIPADGLYLVGTSEVPLIAMHMDEILEDAAAALLRVLVVLPARVGRGAGATRAACSACTSSRRSRWSSYTRARRLVGRARADARDRGVAHAGARDPVPRRQHRGRRPVDARRRSGTTSKAGSRRRSATAS